jgi:4-amino-4-deoxy-L-arabinose transferase-like glycosyltransferase
MSDRRNIVLLFLLAAAIVPYWIGIGDSTLWDANEAFYAETPRVMTETGDYISPSFNGNPRFNKPPLTYWIVAASYQIFGVSEWSERLPIVLAAMGLIAAAFVMGRTVWGMQVGLWSAIVLATLPRFLMHSRRTSIDVFLSLFMGLTLMFFVLSEVRLEQRKLWLCLMYASVGLGYMTKGPVAVVLPGAVFFIYLLIEKRLKDITKMMVPTGIAIFLAIVVPWYLLVYQKHGRGYIVSFLLNENISRYTDEGWGPRRSFFYVQTMLGDLFPWSLLMIAALVCVVFRRKFGERIFGAGEGFVDSGNPPVTTGGSDNAFSIARLIAIWIVVIVGFYSLSRNQQDQYVMPTFMAVAVLVGVLINAFIEKRADALRWIFIVVGALLVLTGGAFTYLGTKHSSIDLAGIGVVGIVLMLGVIATVVFAILKKRDLAVYSQVAAIILLMWIFVIAVLPDFERYKPVKPLSEVIAQNAGPEARVGYFRYTAPTMVFYLHRPVLEYFQEDEMISLFGNNKPAYLIMSEAEYEAIKPKLPAQTRVIASRPLLRVRLNELFSERKEPQIVLVTNEMQK